jgi:hypothetical protein
MRPIALLALAAGLLALATPAFGAVFKGHISGSPDDTFQFLGKFTFSTSTSYSAAGNFTLSIDTPDDGVKVVVYDDESFSWQNVYGVEGCDCECATDPKRSKIHFDVKTGHWESAATIRDVMRPHLWYVVATRCGRPFELDYALHFTQGVTDGEFSSDAIGLLALYGTAFSLWFVGMALQLYTTKVLHRKKMCHPIIRMFDTAVALTLLGYGLKLSHYSDYGEDGEGWALLLSLGDVAGVVGRIVFLTLLVLLSRGWTISSAKIPQRRAVFCALGGLSAAYCTMAAYGVWYRATRPESMTYIYDTAPGICVVVLHVIFFYVFSWSGADSYRSEYQPGKKTFYLRLMLFFGAWILAPPVTALVAGLVDPWVRVIVTETVAVGTDTLWFFVFGLLVWPTRVGRYFKLSRDQLIAATSKHEI